MNGEMCVKVHRTERTASLGNTREAIHAAVVERARIVNEKQINTAIGFRHVMDLLVAMHKPIIGHNMLLDMMQLEAHFCRDLPGIYIWIHVCVRESVCVCVDVCVCVCVDVCV